MKSSLAAGIATSRRITVDRDRTIGFMGEEGRVYATPMLVRDIEQTCRDFLLEHLDPGEDSVGTRVELDHLAPTLMDMWVEIAVTVAEVKGRLVSFEIAAKDALDPVGKGRHIRFVSDVAKTKERLKAKAAKLKAAG
ncbi:MAG: LysR family transcriptional regulator [Alphaproteobacteria bacterium]|nr:LysR family transcriptional regulator [Alphaproteobacteria bacterium]